MKPFQYSNGGQPVAASAERGQVPNMGDTRDSHQESRGHGLPRDPNGALVDSRGQALPRDLNGALLAFNAFLDQNKISVLQSPKGAAVEGERSIRLNTAFPEKTLLFQQNLLKAIEEHFSTKNEVSQKSDAQMQSSVNPLMKAHLRNLIHLTFKRKLFSLQIHVGDQSHSLQGKDMHQVVRKISAGQIQLFKIILTNFCSWRSKILKEESQKSILNFQGESEDGAENEKSKSTALTLIIVDYFLPFIQSIQIKELEEQKMTDTLINLLVFLQLMSESERLREAAIQKGVIIELFKLLPLLLQNFQNASNIIFQKDSRISKSAFFLFEHQGLNMNKLIKSGTQRHGAHNQISLSTRQMIIEQQTSQSFSQVATGGAGAQSKKASMPQQQRKASKQNNMGFNLNLQEVLGGPRLMTGDRHLESVGGLSGGPMSGPSCLGFSGKTNLNTHHQMHQQQYANMDTSGIRNQIYRNGQLGGQGAAMYGGVAVVPGMVQSNPSTNLNSALPPMSTSQSRRITNTANQQPQQYPKHIVNNLQFLPSGAHNKSFDSQQQQQQMKLSRFNQDSSQSPQRLYQQSGQAQGAGSNEDPQQQHVTTAGESRQEFVNNRLTAQFQISGGVVSGQGSATGTRGMDGAGANISAQQNQQRQSVHAMGPGAMNKQTFVRAASEPPHQGKSLNAKSIIIPVQEENENRGDDENANGQQNIVIANQNAGYKQSSSDIANNRRNIDNLCKSDQKTGSQRVNNESNLNNQINMQLHQNQQNSYNNSNEDRLNQNPGQVTSKEQQDESRTSKLQTASNQVIAAYGDPRDQRQGANTSQISQGKRPVNMTLPSGMQSQNKMELPQNVSLSDEESSQQNMDSAIDSEAHSEQIHSENMDTVKDAHKPISAASRSPLIPKLNLVQIKQDSMLGRHRMETSIGHQKIIGTTGGASLMATPGQHQNLNSVALVHAQAPLTSHYPVITSCSPEKRAGDQILYCMNTSNRTSALIPFQVGTAGHPRILTSFTNAVGSNPHLISTESVNEFRMDQSGGQIGFPMGNFLSRGEGQPGRFWKLTSNSKIRQNALSFKQQRNNMILKLKQFHTQHTHNNSDFNQGNRNNGEENQNAKYNEVDQEQFSDPQLNALISEANVTNVSGRQTTNNNRSGSLKILDGMASSTLNPFGGTQASNNLVGLKDIEGGANLPIGMGGMAGTFFNVGAQNGLGSEHRGYDQWVPSQTGGALLLAGTDDPRSSNYDGIASNNLMDLGRQLGESFLARDLACIMTQQRDMELMSNARQTVLEQGQKKLDSLVMAAATQKQEQPGTRSKSMIVSQDILRSNRPSVMFGRGLEDATLQSANQIHNSVSRLQISQSELSSIIILNLIVQLLGTLPNSQIRFLNKSILLNCLLKFMHSNVYQQALLSQSIDKLSDLKKTKWLKEQNHLQKEIPSAIQLNQGLHDDNPGYIAIFFQRKTQMMLSNQNNRIQHLPGHNEFAAHKRTLNFQTEMMPLEFVVLDEMQAVLAILQKFQFANEDIMRRYVQSQFTNFIDRNKPGFKLAVQNIDQECQQQMNIDPNQQFDLTSPQASQQKKKIAIQPEQQQDNAMRTLEEEAEEQFMVNRVQSLKFQEKVSQELGKYGFGLNDLLGDPNMLISNNGATYDTTTAQAIPLSSSGICIPKEVMRRKIDLVLYSICKQIKNLIVKHAQDSLSQSSTPPPSAMGLAGGGGSDLNWFEPVFGQHLTKMIITLSSYISGHNKQSSRVLLSQIIDVAMEPLMMIKRLLADLVLRQKIFEYDPTRPIVAFVQQELIQKGQIVDDQLVIQDDQRSDFQPNQGPMNIGIDPEMKARQGHQPADASFYNQPNNLEIELKLQMQFAANQMIFRHLLSEFLKLLSHILKLPQNCDSLKLLNEVFVGNSTWQSCIEHFSKSIFYQDIVSSIFVDLHRRFSTKLTIDQKCLIYENLEGLRGIRFLNFNQKTFTNSIEFIDSQASLMLGHPIELKQIYESQIKFISLTLCEILHYQKVTMKFTKFALDMFFPSAQKQQRSNDQMKNNLNNGMGAERGGVSEQLHQSSYLQRISHFNNPSRATLYQYNNVSRGAMAANVQTSRNAHHQMNNSFYSGFGVPVNPQGGPLGPQNQNSLNARNLSPVDFPYSQNRHNMNQMQNNQMDTTVAPPAAACIPQENIFSLKTLSSEQKYWEGAVQRLLSQLSYWIHDDKANGMAVSESGSRALLSQYLEINATKYKCFSKYVDSLSNLACPLNFSVTQNALKFLETIFDLSEKFTEQIPIDEVIVVFSRIHHNSFVRLYNQNKKHLSALKEFKKQDQDNDNQSFERDYSPTKLNTAKEMSQNMRQRNSSYDYNEVLKVQLNYTNSLQLCKLHLKCLYAMVRTRTEETRLKLYHFQLFAFLAQEVNLENEYKAKRKKFLNMSKDVAKEANEADNLEIEEVNSPVNGTRNQTAEKGKIQKEISIGAASQNQISQRKIHSFQKEIGYIVDPTVHISNQNIVDPVRMVNNMQIKEIQEPNIEPQNNKQDNNITQPQPIVDNESSGSDMPIPPPFPKSKPSFIAGGKVPSLNIKGLVMSTLAVEGGNGKTAEQIEDMKTLNESKVASQKQQALEQVNEPPYSNSSSDDPIPPPIMNKQTNLQQKLKIPNLPINGLTISTLIAANGLTAEQQSDQEHLASQKQQSAKGSKIAVGNPGMGKRTSQVKYLMNQPNDLHDIRSETELESFSNIQESVNSKKAISQKSATSVNNNLLQENSESGSSDGLPPPLPINHGFQNKLVMPKLEIKGLTMSTLAGDNGLTAEQQDDKKILNESKQTFNKVQAPNDDDQSSSGSSDGIPPPLPMTQSQKPVMPKLEIKGLTMSTLAGQNGLTAEQQADKMILNESKQNNLKKQSSASENSESGSSDGLPPPLPIKKPSGFVLPKLEIGSLGHSTLAKNNGKTAEQEADENMLKQQLAAKKAPTSAQSQSQSSDYDSDDGLPPEISPIPKGTQPANQVDFSGSKGQQPITQPISINQNNSIQASHQIIKDDLSSDSDDGLPPPLPVKSGLFKLGVPKLAIANLGLSTISNAQNGKTAEEMADQEMLMQAKKEAAGGFQKNSDDNSSESDSDLGLPPPLPLPQQNQPQSKFMPPLFQNVQTANPAQPTQQQLSIPKIDQNATSFSGQPNLAPSIPGPSSNSSSSDLGLPPPLPKPTSSTHPAFKLQIGNLGLSTLKKDGQNLTAEEMADAHQLQQSKQAPKEPVAQEASEDDDEEEELSSDEEYYRELERIKREGQRAMGGGAPGSQTQNSDSMMEGGSRSSREDARDHIDAKQENQRSSLWMQHLQQQQLEIQKLQQLHFNTIDQQEPNKIFHQADQRVLSAKQQTESSQMVGSKTLQASRFVETKQKLHQNNQHPNMQKPKQIKINPIKLNIIQRQVAANQESQSQQKVPIKVINKSVTQKIGQLSNTGSGSLSEQLNMKQQPNYVKIVKISQRNQASAQLKSDQSSNKIPLSNEPNPNFDPQFLNQQSDFEELKKKLLNEQIIQRASNNNLGYNASDQKPSRLHKPLVDENLNIKLARSSNDPNQQQRTDLNQNVNSVISNSNIDQTGLVFEPDEKITQLSLRKNESLKGFPGNNISQIKEDGKYQNNDLSKSFSMNERYPPTEHRNPHQRRKTLKATKKRAIKINKEDFYLIEREKRPIYHDEELHKLMLSIILCLLLEPQRGTLDTLYCHQYPIMNGQQNYLYILHQHISHQQNMYVIQGLLQEMSKISPPLAGQRLLKLMCPQLFDLKLYNNGKNWKKLAEGAYGTVYECKTNLIQPKKVAIKRMSLPSDIFDRCVLHDIFTEITCLEEFRLEKCVTDLYDYGVDSQSYYIVMKKYTCSLGEWRRRQGDGIEVFLKNLKLYFSIYNKVLKSLGTIHSHKVTHYDIKCDNVLINFVDEEDEDDDKALLTSGRQNKTRDLTNLTDDDFEITIGDFGECKIFSNDKDEFCTRTRGTDSIKSPEMLQLTIHTRKDHHQYDRRKQVGTNQLSDIWSIGCLFYELCTGEFLLYEPDFFLFMHRVTNHAEELIKKEKLEKIDNNLYIKDFLKFILIRDQRLRPTIDKVIKKFELLHKLVCNLSEADMTSDRGNGQGDLSLQNNGGFPQLSAHMVIKSNTEMHECLHKVATITENDRIPLDPGSFDQINGKIAKKNLSGDEKVGSENLNNYKPGHSRYAGSWKQNQLKEQDMITRILESIFICQYDFVKHDANIQTIMHFGITHLVMNKELANQNIRNKFEVLVLDSLEEVANLNPFKLMPVIMDFIRKITLLRGRLLFVENRTDNLMKECVLIAMNHIFKTNIFDTYTLIKSQCLFFRVEAVRLQIISEWNMLAQKIRQYLTTFPQFSCHCGASLIILERSFAQYQNMQSIVPCKCLRKVNVHDQNSFLHLNDLSHLESSPHSNFSTCPCAANTYASCSEYLDFLDRYYFAGRGSNGTHISLNPLLQQSGQQSAQHHQAHHQLSGRQLYWAFLDAQDFVLGPDTGLEGARMAGTGTEVSVDPSVKSLESRRSQASSSRKSSKMNAARVPAIPLGQVVGHMKGKSSGGHQGIIHKKNMSNNYIQGQSSAFSQHEPMINQSTRGGGMIPRFSKNEKQIVSNLSQSISVNGISVVSRKKIRVFQNQIRELRIAFYNRQQYLEAQAVASPDTSPSPNMMMMGGGLPPFGGVGGLRNGKGLASGTSLLSNTPDQNSRRQLKNLNMSQIGAVAASQQSANQSFQQFNAQMNQSMQHSINIEAENIYSTKWVIKKCSICQCWTHAYHAGFKKYAILLNNRLKQHSHGLLSRPAITAQYGQIQNGNGVLSGLGLTSELEHLEKQFLLVKEEYQKRLLLLDEQQEILAQNFNAGGASASRIGADPQMIPVQGRGNPAERIGGSMFSNFQKNTPGCRQVGDRMALESFTYGNNESVMLSSSIGLNRISSHRGRHLSSLAALSRPDDNGFGGTPHMAGQQPGGPFIGGSGQGNQDGVRVPILQNLGIQLPF